jgi:tetratricopeptide (TPR) repeat protein
VSDSKIALALIVKDDSEVDILERCFKTVAPFVDAIFITGTKEPQVKIQKLCKKYNAVWSWFKWCNDFSAARNFNFSQVPKEYQWILWMDTDDVLQGGEKLREAVKLAEENNIGAVFARYLYQVELDEKGKIKEILIEHLRERLIKNDGSFEWVAPIHETLIEKVPVNKTDFQGFFVVHLATESNMLESMYRNVEILQEEVLRNSADPRPIYYLAKAYFDTKAPELLYEKLGNGCDSYAMELFKDYIRKSGWAEERAQCWEYIAMIHRERGEYKLAITALLEGIAEEPKFPSLPIQMALTYVYLKDWPKAQIWVKSAEGMEMPKTTLVYNPRDYKALLLEVYYHIFLNTGQLEKCQAVATAMLNLLPNELNANRLKDIQSLHHRNNLAHMVVKLAYHLKQTERWDRLAHLVDSVPKEIAMEPVLVQLRNEFLPPKVWGENDLVIFCGPGFEKWSPNNVAQGIGGSEEAVIYLSKELTKLGWNVTVFADPQDDAGVYEGVDYRPYYEINWKDEFNVFISWRHIDVFDIPAFKAKKAYLWNHDIQNPLTYTPERVAKFDKAFFLSKWHRENVPALSEDKVMITANGINI